MERKHNFKREYKDIKICRLCGCDDKENVDIFSRNTPPPINQTDDLLNKILTVYPLLLYKDDPLPQNICRKCINNVSSSYQDIQQVLRQQNKWMSLTKAVQPEHKYFRILNAVENSTRATKESIQISFNIEFNQAPLKKLVALTGQKAQDSHSNSNLRNLPATPTNEKKDPITVNTNTKSIVNENVVKNIQTKLESNGFTIKRIKVATAATTATTKNQDLTYNNTPLELQTSTDSTTEATVSCKYCKLKFSNLKILAQHQLIHLNVSTTKIFQKRLLPKNLRRGRLITINDSKTIRCLNCWRIYRDNKAILQHWSCGDCDFYCFICGKEFPQSPKLLREHIPQEHGISYRSAMRQFVSSQGIKPLPAFDMPLKMPTYMVPSIKQQLATNVIKKVNKYKKPPRSCTKNDDGTITCKVCHKVFDNFRSSNSHMRKHKPPQKFGEKHLTFPTKIDSYNTQDEYASMQPTTSHQPWNPRQTYAESQTMHQTPSQPPYRVLPQNGPLTGIKTNILQNHQDFSENTKIRVKTMESLTGNTPFPSMSTETDDNIIVPELLTPVIKSEPIVENESFNNDTHIEQHSEYIPEPPIIKTEPGINVAYDETDNYLICFICNESFVNRDDYQMHSMYAHNMH